MIQLMKGVINRQKAAEYLYNIIIKLERLPPRQDREEERISVILGILNPRNLTPKSVLDVGAGTCGITTALKKWYNLPTNSIFAIDQKLPQITDITPLTYDDGKIPLPDNSIDLIVMFVVLHHIPPTIRPSIISEISRVLSPSGGFIIREHDNDGTPEFYTFLDMLHLFWYIAYGETPDPLYLMSRTETQTLLKQHGLQPNLYHSYGEINPQHLYHELYIKTPQTQLNYPYVFSSLSDQLTLQTYIDKLKLVQPRNYQTFLNIVPSKLQQGLISKYGPDLQTNIDPLWPNIIRDIALSVILGSIKYSNLLDNKYFITSEAISRSIADLT